MPLRLPHPSASWLLVASLALCAPLRAYTISGINGNTLTNHNVGFHGFSLTFPEGYSVWVPPDSEEGQEASCPFFAWMQAKDTVRVSPGWATNETWVYSQESSAIGFSVLTINALPMAINRLPKDEVTHYAFHDANVPKWMFGDATQFLSKVEEINGVSVGKAAYKCKDYIFAIYFVPGTLKECFLFSGVSELDYQDHLLEDMDKVVKTLKFK